MAWSLVSLMRAARAPGMAPCCATAGFSPKRAMRSAARFGYSQAHDSASPAAVSGLVNATPVRERPDNLKSAAVLIRSGVCFTALHHGTGIGDRDAKDGAVEGEKQRHVGATMQGCVGSELVDDQDDGVARIGRDGPATQQVGGPPSGSAETGGLGGHGKYGPPRKGERLGGCVQQIRKCRGMGDHGVLQRKREVDERAGKHWAETLSPP